MNKQGTSTDARDPGEPNLRPGPQDQGGHGGMATREQEKRVHDGTDSAGVPPVEDTRASARQGERE